jgi:DNA-directed RNA polymerase subunit alpha
METLPLPKTYKFISEEGDNSVFVLEPCYPGYGVTIGNAIRRILLSSLPGAAVTAVKIKGVDHEFSTVPNVKEDVVDIILNLKQLRLLSHSAEPVRLSLKVKGDKTVTAGMISKNDQVEVINPDLKIATLDGKSAELEMELVVEQGRGYVPIEAREDEKLEIGMIAVDAIYTPIRNVNFSVENVRVGKMTNYDRLTLYITTSGAITGREALDQASRIAVEHFQLLFKESFERSDDASETTNETKKLSATEELAPEKVETAASEEPGDLVTLGLSRRAYNALVKNGVKNADQLKGLVEADLQAMQGLGEKSIQEILEAIKKL